MVLVKLGKSHKSDELATALSGLSLEDGELPAKPVRGLRNLGNTCFFNSTLQCLLGTDELRSCMLAAAEEGEGVVTQALRFFFHQMHSGNSAAIAPSKLLQCVSVRHRRFAGRAQQDAQEVLRNLLSSVCSEEVARLRKLRGGGGAVRPPAAEPAGEASEEEGGGEEEGAEEEAEAETGGEGGGEAEAEADEAEERSSTPKPATVPAAPKPDPDPPTLVDHIFGGEMRSTIVCLSCGSFSCNHEGWLDLSLPFCGAAGEAAQRGRKKGDDDESRPQSKKERKLVLRMRKNGKKGEEDCEATEADSARSTGAETDGEAEIPTPAPAPAALAPAPALAARLASEAEAAAWGASEEGGAEEAVEAPWRHWSEAGVEQCVLRILKQLPLEQIAPKDEISLEASLQAFLEPELLQSPFSSSYCDAYDCDECTKRFKEDLARNLERKKAAEAAAGREGGGVVQRRAKADADDEGEGEEAEEGEEEEEEEEEERSPLPRQPALRWLSFVGLPKVLTLHVKRFSVTGRVTSKRNEHIKFPLQLSLGAFTGAKTPPKSLADLSEPSSLGSGGYSLFGVVEHQGSFSGGHYVAFVRGAEGAWHHLSDSHVSPATEAQVLAAQAFLLFYAREESD